MFGIEIRFNCTDYIVVSTPTTNREGIILREWGHGGSWGPRTGLAHYRRSEKRRGMVRQRLGAGA